MGSLVIILLLRLSYIRIVHELRVKKNAYIMLDYQVKITVYQLNYNIKINCNKFIFVLYVIYVMWRVDMFKNTL